MTSEIGTAPPQAPVAQQENKGFLQRVIGVLFSPDETFQDIARRPDVLWPLVLLMVVTLASTVIVVPRMDFETMMRDNIERSGKNMAPEDADRMVRVMTASAKVFGYASPILAIAVWAIVAGVLLIAFRLFGGEGTFKQAFSVTLYGWLPLLINSIIATIILAAKGSVDPTQMSTLVRSNLAFLVDPKANPLAFAALSSLDIFTVWSLVLFVIGFAYVAGMSKARSAAIVISLWVVAIFFKVGFAAIGAAKAKAAAAS
ncbi:MAG TPA: Yip1 family protein [Thermoanaerobaculia bacterium]